MERHLRLVTSRAIKHKERTSLFEKIENVAENIKSAFVSENEKIYVLKDILLKIYRDYEITTGIIDEPYFIKAEKKMRRIIREHKVDYYYNLLKKFRNY